MNEFTTSPHFQGLRTAIYRAPDLDKAKEWYSRVLGIAPYFDQPFYVGFSVGGYELGLDPDASSTPAGPGGVIVYWGVSDASAALERLLSLGAIGRTAVQDVGARASESPRFSIRSVTCWVSSRIHTSSFPPMTAAPNQALRQPLAGALSHFSV
jgi:predicted enzyme related to lactoylglutathione lyase